MLVVGINYAPEHTGIAPYTTALCEHLARSGSDVFVLTGTPHYPHWTTAPEYRHLRTRAEVNRVAIRRLRHFVPTTQSAARRAAYELTFGAQVLTQRLPWRPDVVVSVVPSLAGALAASIIAARHRARFVVWVQDLMGPATSESGIRGGRRLRRVVQRLEKAVLNRADAITVISDAFRHYIEELGVDSDAIRFIPNWSHVRAPSKNRRDVRAGLRWRDDELIVLHAGNMGLKQGLPNVIDAACVAKTKALPIRFVLMGDGSQRHDLEERARGVESVEFLPPASDDDFIEVLAAADVLLVNEAATVRDMSMPSKLTSYFAAGRPIVAAVRSDGATALEVHRSGAGVVVPSDSPSDLVAAVALLGSDPHASDHGCAGRLYAARQLTADHSLLQLQRLVESRLARPADLTAAV